jgi:hypothetical protein
MSTNAQDIANNIALSAGEIATTQSENLIDQAANLVGVNTNKTRIMAFGFKGSGDGAYRTTDNVKGSNVGIRPVAGIKSMSCEYLSGNEMYSARQATVQWSAPSLEALQQYEVFCTVGFQVALQWGWVGTSAILDNNQTFITITDQGIYVNQELWTQPNKKILDANGNMDAIGGQVSNYTIKLRDDGGFDCTTDIIAMGINFFSAGTDDQAEGGIGALLPKSMQQEIEDVKKGLKVSFTNISIKGVADTVTGAGGEFETLGKTISADIQRVKNFFGTGGGLAEESEETKKIIELSTQDHLLNAILNLDRIVVAKLDAESVIACETDLLIWETEQQAEERWDEEVKESDKNTADIARKMMLSGEDTTGKARIGRGITDQTQLPTGAAQNLINKPGSTLRNRE